MITNFIRYQTSLCTFPQNSTKHWVRQRLEDAHHSGCFCCGLVATGLPILLRVIWVKLELFRRYVKLRVCMRRECRERFFPLPRVSDPAMHHGTFVAHVPWCMLGSLTSDFFEVSGGEKRSRHSRRMRNTQFYVSGKRPIARVAVK